MKTARMIILTTFAAIAIFTLLMLADVMIGMWQAAS